MNIPASNVILSNDKESDLHFSNITSLISPKKPSVYTYKPYYQVFNDRYGFIPNLSIIDLLFNIGPKSKEYLDQNYKNNE